jgi:hypothetical protein
MPLVRLLVDDSPWLPILSASAQQAVLLIKVVNT